MVIATRIASSKRIIASCQLCCEEMLKIETPNMSRKPPRPAWSNATNTRKINRFCLNVLIIYFPDKRSRVSSEGGNSNRGGCDTGGARILGASCVISFMAIEISTLF